MKLFQSLLIFAIAAVVALYKILDFQESQSIYEADTIYVVNKEKKDAALLLSTVRGVSFSEHPKGDEAPTEADVIAVFAASNDK